MSRIDPSQLPKWEAIVSKTYAEQCRWILNGFWAKLSNEAENFFQFVPKDSVVGAGQI